MAIKSNVVIHNATTKKHEPLATGDKLSGSVIQLSTDAGNSISTGTDGGLLVAAVVALPDDQVLTGDNSGSVELTLTPATQPNGDVNYTVKGDVKIAPAAGNAAVAGKSIVLGSATAELFSNAARTASATRPILTITGFGTNVNKFLPNGTTAIGQLETLPLTFTTPQKAQKGTAVVITLPAYATCVGRLQATYTYV